MDYQVSARKYRPGAFRDVIGQPHVVQTLINAITSHRIAHAFLFSGTRGVGKTTVARILAKALNCQQGPTGTPCETCPNCLEITQGTSVDVIEIDGASNTGVDDVREIRENVKFTPFRGSYRVYIIDEVHMLSNSAFNALLKTLEEPPAHVVFIFATTEIHKIPPTILSRCQHHNFRRIPKSELVSRLRHVAEQDGIDVEDRSLTSIARASEGSMRDGLSLLDQAVAFGGKTIRHADLESLLGSVPLEQVRAMISAVIHQDSPGAVRVIAHLLDQGHDLRAYCRELVEHTRNLLVAAVVPSSQGPQALQGLIDLSEEEIGDVITDAKALTPEQVQELFRIFSDAEDALRQTQHPRFVLEVAAVRATRLIRANTALPQSRVEAASQPPGGQDRPIIPKGQAAKTAASTPYKTSSQAGRGGPPTSAAITIPRPQQPAQVHAQPSEGATIGESPARERASSPPVSTSSQGMAPPERLQAAPASMAISWEQIVERVERAHPNVGPFLAMGSLMTTEGNQITIGYPKTATVALTRIQKEDTLQLVTGVCTELAGQPVRLRVVELPEGQIIGPTLTQQREMRERTRKDSLLAQTRSHPLVKQTLEMFGGDVVEVRPTSSQEETR